jgi:hypothetical protein
MGDYGLETCAWCNGAGKRGGIQQRCEVCDGKSKLMVLQPAHRCIDCNCTGRLGLSAQMCLRCQGSGWESVLRTAKKDIPR